MTSKRYDSEKSHYEQHLLDMSSIRQNELNRPKTYSLWCGVYREGSLLLLILLLLLLLLHWRRRPKREGRKAAQPKQIIMAVPNTNCSTWVGRRWRRRHRRVSWWWKCCSRRQRVGCQYRRQCSARALSRPVQLHENTRSNITVQLRLH